MNWNDFEQSLQNVGLTEIGPRLMAAYSAALLRYLRADGCVVLQAREQGLATVLVDEPATQLPPAQPVSVSQLDALTATEPFFLISDFVPRRALKPLLGRYQQLAGLRLDNYMFKGWVLVGWHTPTHVVAQQPQLTLYRFADKVLLHHLSLQKISSEQQFRFLFATVPQAIVRINEDEQTTWVNQAALDLLGLEPGELSPSVAQISEAMMQLLSRATNRAAIIETANRMMQDPAFTSKDWLWVFADRALSVQTIPIHSPYFRGRIWLFNDVWDLYRKNEQLQDANREIENLIGVIAHDLKAPLATISAVLHMLPTQGMLTDDQLDNVDYGLRTVQRGAELIDSIVYYNRLISPDQPVEQETIDLNDLIDVVAEGFEGPARQKNIRLHVHQPAELIQLRTDPELLVRVLDNLLSNALKFSPFHKNVYIDVAQHPTTLHIAITDEGPGISPQDRPRLFKRFQRLSAQPTNRENSTGLGLSIAKALTEKLGASIDVDSVLGRGTTFRLVFPAHYVSSGPLLSHSADAPASEQPASV